jgi:long-chain acyl-CoA synthetase
MNVFDYLFENTFKLKKEILVGEETLTYQELYQKSLALSDGIGKTIGENNNIILISPNNTFFLIAYLAIIKSGNCVIPLDPMIGTDGFNFIHELTESKMLFITPDVMKRLSLQEKKCFFPSDLFQKLTYSDTRTDQNFNEERLAEIIFTSGSTGTPNGVMLTHRNLIANTRSIIEYLRLNERDRMLVVLPFYYCYGLSLLHTHLRVGASIVFNNSFMFYGSVINDLKKYECTGFAGVPSHFQILLRKSDTFKTTDFPHLKYVTQAGGKLATVFIDEFLHSHPCVKFIVMYGQTEATARLSYLPPELFKDRKGSVGKEIPGVILRVVDESGENVKPGEIGEVIAKGDNVMKGYFKDDEGTAAVLKNGWLYTGDLGTVDADGYIYLTARKKEIIKVRGKRISPKEIESVILELQEVIDCSIESAEDKHLGEILKAILVVSENGIRHLNSDAVRKHCTGRMELYKIPQQYEFVEQMMVGATGKKIKKGF